MRLLLSLQFLALSFLVAANTHAIPHQARRAHDSIARRAPGDVTAQHHKRFSNTRFTFYDVGLGACGKTNVASDFIVALNTAQFGGGYPGPNCFKQISISYGGKTTSATIMDECPGCPYGGLDFSRGLFQFFAPESAGVIYGEWHFTDGSGSDPTTDTPEPTKTTSSKTPTPTPTTTKEEPPTTTSSPPPSTTSSKTSSSSTYSSSKSSESPSSSSSSSSSSVNYNSGAASGLASPTPLTISDNAPHNILGMNQVIVAVGAIIRAGGRAE